LDFLYSRFQPAYMALSETETSGQYLQDKYTFKKLKEYFSIMDTKSCIKMICAIGMLKCFFGFFPIKEIIGMMRHRECLDEFSYVCRIPENKEKGTLEFVVILQKAFGDNLNLIPSLSNDMGGLCAYSFFCNPT